MGDKKAFKEIPLDKLQDEDLNNYIVNLEKQTAIKIPNKVDKILTKFRDPSSPQSILASDIITIALRYKSIDYAASRKLVFSSLSSELMVDYFKTEEISNLLDFLFQVPTGYRFNYHAIWHHSEIPMVQT